MMVSSMNCPREMVEAQSRGGEREDPRRVNVTPDLQRILRTVGQLVDVDEQ